MKALTLITFAIALQEVLYECFYIPQSYNVKLYHHESMLISGDNGTEENYILNMEESIEDHTKHSSRRKKRTAKNSNRVNQDILYEDESLYESSFESNKESGRNNTNHTDDYEAKNSNRVNQDILYEDESLYEGSFESNKESGRNNTNHTDDYDYERFKNEYYYGEQQENRNTTNETLYEEYPEDSAFTTPVNFNKTMHKNTTDNVPMENYCSVVLLFRTRVLECFFYGISQDDNDITYHSAGVISFWFILYVMGASYLWCTRGWCCCCCPCACCHPHSVIHEAKQFLTQNPPGEAQLYSKSKVFYKPSDYEKECYKSLESEVYNF